MAKVLVVTYGGGHVNMLVPLIRRLKLDGYEVQVLGLTTAGNILANAGIAFFGFKDLIEYTVDPQQALQLGRQLVGTRSQSSSVPYDESVAYHGVCYLELVTEFGEKAAAELYARKGRQAFMPKQILRKLIASMQPDLVVATNSPRSEQAAIEAAAELSVPALCLVDLFAKQAIDWIAKQGYANKVCVMSEYVRQAFIAAGRKELEVVATGNPIFDQLEAVRTTIKERQQISARERVVLWASQIEPAVHPFTGAVGLPTLPRKIEEQLLHIAAKHPDRSFIFRPHPSENTICQSLPANVRISDKTEDLHGLLTQVDTVVTMTSTVGLEAALVGLPVVTVDLSVITSDAPYSEMGISIGVRDLSQLDSVIDKCLHQGHQVDKHALPEFGTAVDNIMKEIEALVAHVS